MKYGARNKITAKVTSIQSDQIMSLVKFDVLTPAQMASVLTTESVKELGLKVGDTILLVIKAIHVLPVKESTSAAVDEPFPPKGPAPRKDGRLTSGASATARLWLER